MPNSGRRPIQARATSSRRNFHANFVAANQDLIFGPKQLQSGNDLTPPAELYSNIIDPEKWPRELFNFVQAVLLIYVAIIVPYRIGFDIDLEPFSSAWWWELVIDLYFLTDLVSNFYTGFYDKDDMLEMRQSLIAKNYLQFWFWVDLASCLPVQYIQLLIQGMTNKAASNVKLVKMMRLVRLAKLLRLAKLRDVLYQYEEQLESVERAGKLVGAAALVLYTCHLFGCMWYLVGTLGSEDGTPGWIEARGLDANGTGTQTKYLTSYYWAITVLTTVGFGDISAVTNTEMVFSSFAEITGCFMFATLMGSVAAIVLGEAILKARVSEQMDALNEYMRSKNVPAKLRTKVRVFLEDVYEVRSPSSP